MNIASTSDIVDYHHFVMEYFKQLNYLSNEENEYISSFVTDLNNISVDLYNRGVCTHVFDFLKYSLNTMLLLARNFTHNKVSPISSKDKIAKNALLKIMEGKNILFENNVQKPQTSLDLYFLPYSKCDSNACLSQPMKINCKRFCNAKKLTAEIVSTVLLNLSLIYLHQGNNFGAKDILEKARIILSEGNSSKSYHVFSSILNCLGCIQYKLDNIVNARELFLQAYKTAEMAFKKTSHNVEESKVLNRCAGTACSNLGRIHFIRKEYDLAMNQCWEAVRHKKAALGDDHNEVRAAMYNLGLIYQKQGGLEQAISCYQRFLNKSHLLSCEHGISNRDIVTVLTKMLSIFYSTKEISNDSIVTLQALKKLESLRDIQGYDDDRFPAILNCIGSNFVKHGFHQYALPFFLEQLRIEMLYLGSNHPDLATTFNNIGKVYQQLQHFRQANLFFENVLKVLDSNGEKNKLYALALFDIGINKYESGLYEESLEFFRESIDKQKKIIGGQHPEVADMQHKFCLILLDMGRLDEAMKILMEALLIRRLMLGNDDQSVVEILLNIGQIHDIKGEDREALNVFHETLRIERKRASESLSILVILWNIGRLFEKVENLHEAIKSYEEILSIIRSTYADQHWVQASLYNIIGSLYNESGMFSEADRAFVASRRVMERIANNLSDSEFDYKIMAFIGDYSAMILPAAAAA